MSTPIILPFYTLDIAIRDRIEAYEIAHVWALAPRGSVADWHHHGTNWHRLEAPLAWLLLERGEKLTVDGIRYGAIRIGSLVELTRAELRFDAAEVAREKALRRKGWRRTRVTAVF